MSRGIGIMRKIPTMMDGWSSVDLNESRPATGNYREKELGPPRVDNCQLVWAICAASRGRIRLCSYEWAGTLEVIPCR